MSTLDWNKTFKSLLQMDCSSYNHWNIFRAKATNINPPKVSLYAMVIMKLAGRICGEE